MATHTVVEVDCTDTGTPADVDTLDDLRVMQRATHWDGAVDREKDRDADH
jgi:hypothetical protein